MKRLWNILFGPAAPCGGESCDEAVARARRLLAQGNHEDACRLLRRGERQGHAEAMYLLACCCWEGQGVREDAGRARRLWQRAAAMGYGPAQARLDELRLAHERLQRQIEREEQGEG